MSQMMTTDVNLLQRRRIVNIVGWTILCCICVMLAKYTVSGGAVIVFATFVTIPILFLILSDPTSGLLIWVSLSPLLSHYVRINLGEGIPDLTFDRLVIFLIFISLITSYRIRKKRFIPNTNLEMLMVFFSFSLIFSIPRSLNPISATQTVLDSYLMPFVLFFLAKNLFDSDKKLNTLLNALLFMGVYSSLIGIFEYATGMPLFDAPIWKESAVVRRVPGSFGSPEIFGAVLASIFPIALYKYFQQKKISRKLLFVGVLTLVSIGIFLSFFRTCWLSLFIVLSIMVVLSRKFRKMLLPLVIISGVILFWSWDRFKYTLVYERLTSQGPILTRLGLLATAVKMFLAKSIIGFGFGNFNVLFADFRSPFLSIPGTFVHLPSTGRFAAHNSYLTILVETGIIGFIPFLLILAIILQRGWRLYRTADGGYFKDKEWYAVFIAVFFAFTVPGLFQSMFHYSSFSNQLFYLIAGVVMRQYTTNFIGNKNKKC